MWRKENEEMTLAWVPRFLAWKAPWTEEPAGLESIVSQVSDLTEAILAHMHECQM